MEEMKPALSLKLKKKKKKSFQSCPFFTFSSVGKNEFPFVQQVYFLNNNLTSLSTFADKKWTLLALNGSPNCE